MPNFTSLIQNPGIVAVTVAPAHTHTPHIEHHGLEQWRPVVTALIVLLAGTDEAEARLVLGEHTVLVQVEGDLAVGVVLPTGHAIAKSVRRMIRRTARAKAPAVVITANTPSDPAAAIAG